MAKGINIFGVKFAYPKGLHKSPGTNWFASCIGAQLGGKKFSNKQAQRQGFRQAAQACRSTGRK